MALFELRRDGSTASAPFAAFALVRAFTCFFSCAAAALAGFPSPVPRPARRASCSA